MQLRHYQDKAVKAIVRSICRTENERPLVVLPTGTGKSLVCAALCQKILEMAPTSKIVVATHTQEIVKQNHDELLAASPFASAGIYAAGLNKRNAYRKITFASIQSIFKKPQVFGKVNLLIIDEAHTIPKTGNGMWWEFIRGLQEQNPELRVVGLTATPYRLDTGALFRGDGALFTNIAYEYPILQAIEEGYLCPVVTSSVDTHFDVSDVHKRKGEFIQSELETTVNRYDINSSVVDEIIRKGAMRKKWLVFAAGVKHARALESELIRRGIACAVVTGEAKEKTNRKHYLDQFQRGELRALINVDVLTTGYNEREIDLIACARPTESTGLWVQMLGRGTRLADGKKDCLVLDFADNGLRHGPIDKIRPKDKTLGSGNGEAPIKQCDACGTFCYAGVRRCHSCGAEFPENDLKINGASSQVALLSTQFESQWLAVIDMKLELYRPGLIRVIYKCGRRTAFEYVSSKNLTKFNLQHGCKAESLTDLLTVKKKIPAKLCVLPSGKNWKVISKSFTL